ERDRDDVAAADDAGSTADEDEREGADKLGETAAEDVLVHRLRRLRGASDSAWREDSLVGVRGPRERGQAGGRLRGRVPALPQELRRNTAERRPHRRPLPGLQVPVLQALRPPGPHAAGLARAR